MRIIEGQSIFPKGYFSQKIYDMVPYYLSACAADLVQKKPVEEELEEDTEPKGSLHRKIVEVPEETVMDPEYTH